MSEPSGSTYHDPSTGGEVGSGPIVDVHNDGLVSADVTGSFRELLLFIQDDNTLTEEGRSSGSAINPACGASESQRRRPVAAV